MAGVRSCKVIYEQRLRRLRASFTIEAALIVPVVLALVFLGLGTILYLHDRVWAQAWAYEQAWWTRMEEESGEPMPPCRVPRLSAWEQIETATPEKAMDTPDFLRTVGALEKER